MCSYALSIVILDLLKKNHVNFAKNKIAQSPKLLHFSPRYIMYNVISRYFDCNPEQ